MEYYGKIKERCIAKPETYETRKQRREAEIQGLKDALNILENESLEALRRLAVNNRPLGLTKGPIGIQQGEIGTCSTKWPPGDQGSKPKMILASDPKQGE